MGQFLEGRDRIYEDTEHIRMKGALPIGEKILKCHHTVCMNSDIRYRHVLDLFCKWCWYDWLTIWKKQNSRWIKHLNGNSKAIKFWEKIGRDEYTMLEQHFLSMSPKKIFDKRVNKKKFSI